MRAKILPKRHRYEIRFKLLEGLWRFYKGRRIIGRFETKAAAIAYAEEVLNGLLHDKGQLSELVIKLKDNSIQDTRTYGADPRRSKG